MATIQNPIVEKTYRNWQPVSGDTSGLAFNAVCEQDGKHVRIQLLPWLNKRPEIQQEINERLEAIDLLRSPASLEVVEFYDKEGTPRLVIATTNSHSLSEFFTKLNFQQSLELAIELCQTLANLIHYRISCDSACLNTAEVIQSGDRYYLQINLFEKYLTESAYNAASTIQVSDIREVLSMLLDAKTNNSDGEIPARLQAILRRLLTEREDDLDLEDFLSQANSELTEIAQNLYSSSQTAALRDEDKTSVLPEIASPSDQTAEVDVQPLSPPLDESTMVFTASDDAKVQADASRANAGDQLGRYRLETLLGEGGMGYVFKATDITNQSTVAVKVLRRNQANIEQAIRRFKKEARILSSVQNQYVTQLIEVGIENGQHFLVMEYVEGINLKDWLQDRLPMEERLALQIIADIARGLVDAHQQEIIHRDIKPENILLKRLDADKPATEYQNYQVKLTDFGIARHVNQSASLEVTRAGTMIGTPSYMSPEQCRAADEIGPAADVYSLGVTLYLLLAGQLPFIANDAMNLAAMHCFEPVPSIQKLNRSISDPSIQLLNKMLEKSADHRHADAAQLVRAIDQLLNGQSSDLSMHPRPPEYGSGKLWQRTFEWDLKSSPEELWPHVSNTDRLNRAAGLQSVQYRTVKDEKLGLRKFGSFRLGGIQIEWEEHPFEWVEGQRMGVLREFSSGPFQWFMSSVELTRKPDGGSHLKHSVQIMPRNTLGRVVSTIEAGWKGFRALDRIYNRIDQSIQNQNTNKTQDPFEESERLNSLQAKRLVQRSEELVRRGIDETVVTKLTDFVRNASPQALAQIRPYALAEQLDIDPVVMLDACLVAADCRMLVLKWDILCPTCRVSAATADVLSNIDQHTDCEACDREFQSNLGEAIELVFQAHPDVRNVDTGKYCIGGPEHAPHVACQLRLQPGERIEVDVPVVVGDYLLRATRLAGQHQIRVRSQSAPSQLDVSLSRLGTGDQQSIRSGQVSLSVLNDFPSVQVVRLERVIARKNVVTAAAVTTMPRFRELFPHQVFRRDVPMLSEEVTLMAASLTGLEPLYSSLGEAETYILLQKAMTELEKCVSAHSGAIVRSNGEYLLAAFQRVEDAIKSAIGFKKQMRYLDAINDASFNVSVHRGQTLVTTQNGRLDYFGLVPRRANELLESANGRMILTDSVFSDENVQTLIEATGAQCQFENITFKDGRTLLTQIVAHYFS